MACVNIQDWQQEQKNTSERLQQRDFSLDQRAENLAQLQSTLQNSQAVYQKNNEAHQKNVQALNTKRQEFKKEKDALNEAVKEHNQRVENLSERQNKVNGLAEQFEDLNIRATYEVPLSLQTLADMSQRGANPRRTRQEDVSRQPSSAYRERTPERTSA